jgi:hypothetical protein
LADLPVDKRSAQENEERSELRLTASALCAFFAFIPFSSTLKIQRNRPSSPLP